MNRDQEDKFQGLRDPKALIPSHGGIVRELFTLSGTETLRGILGQDRPAQLVQSMARVDFFWLVKKIGAEDALPLLRMASFKQWQYILDMELWQRDRLDMEETSLWLGWFLKAHPKGLVRWLFSDGELLGHWYLFNKIQVEIRRGDEAYDLPDSFFTLDNLYYIRILDNEQEDLIKSLLREMAKEDYDRYQALLLTLGGVLPDEVEEEIYRLRNVRLAEDGFLPPEEAASIYSPLKAETLRAKRSLYKLPLPPEGEGETLVPISPLTHAPEINLLVEVLGRETDALFVDRMRLEFAGLCNQILSADGLKVEGEDDLIDVCRKAAGYIHIGLEKTSGGHKGLTEQILRKNPLVAVFRVGFGIALEIKWKAERWIKEAWFARQRLKRHFWGYEWGGILEGLLHKRPLLFTGIQDGKEYKEFEQLQEIENCRVIIDRLKVVDRLLETLIAAYPMTEERIEDSHLTFHSLLFNFWAREQLRLDPGFAPLTLEKVKDLFLLLRAESPRPPYRMPGSKATFVDQFMAWSADLDPEASQLLRDTLSLLWEEFLEEYAWVATADLDSRFAKFILVRPSS